MDSDDRVELIKSNKGGLKLIHRGYMYTVHKKRQGGGIRWRCTQRGLHCKGSISTGSDPPKINMPHNHIPDPHSVALARCRQLEELAGEPLSQPECEEDSKVENKRKGYNVKDPAPFLEERVLSVIEKVLMEDGLDEDAITAFDPLADDNDSLPIQERLNQTAPATITPIKSTPPPLKQLVSSPNQFQMKINKQEPPVLQAQNNNIDDKDPDEVCLRWNSHHSNMKSTFPSLLQREKYVDCTVCSGGKTIKCHRIILSSCSSYFEDILSGITPMQHPVIFLKGIPFWIVKALIDFMYVGEVHIEQTKLQQILDVAEALKVKGLTGKSPSNKKEEPKPAPPPEPSPVPPVLKSQKFMPPLRLSVTKEQAASLQTIDPLSLLKPSFYEENVPSPATITKKSPVTIKPKMGGMPQQSLAEFTAKQKDWLSKKIPPRKKFKRKSTEHEPSPPPVILRKGTKSRPIVKAPKYYHMEYEEREDRAVKTEDEERGEEPELDEPPPELQQQQPTDAFDISNVKAEPVDVDVDIEENDVNIENNEEANAFITESLTTPATNTNKDEGGLNSKFDITVTDDFMLQLELKVNENKVQVDEPGGTENTPEEKPEKE